MKRLEVSGAVRLIYRSLGVKGLKLLWDYIKPSFLTRIKKYILFYHQKLRSCLSMIF